MATKTVRQQLIARVERAVGSLYESGVLAGDLPRVELTLPKQAGHGDFACAVALQLAKAAKKNPREIAGAIESALGDAGGMLERVEVAGPGYLNLFVSRSTWHAALAQILEAGAGYIRSDVGGGRKVLIEFVSANPTGPLHVAHGRGAVTGDVIARLLDAAGFRVEREYYVNDLGNQVDVFAHSIYLRYRELHGKPFTPPEEFYPGEYVVDIAKVLQSEFGARYVDAREQEWLDAFRKRGVELMMERIKADLAAFAVRFDRYVSEKELTQRIGLQTIVERLRARGLVYEQDGKQWFKTTALGDDKDRVIVREDGRPTYIAPDIAYHDDKLQRGHEHLIDVLGADHGGYVARMKAGIAALGWKGDPLEVILVQMVSLVRGDQTVKMGKRLGTAVWLRDVVNEAGRDATRYLFAMRRTDSQMDFDIDLATKKSIDNPVYYAQMGHARMASIARKARAAGVPEPELATGALDALTLPEEIALVKAMSRAPEVVAQAALTREPHQIPTYLQELIAQFHSYYTQYKNSEKVVSADASKTRARLLLCRGLGTVLAALLTDVLGVDAPAEMYLKEEEES